MLGKEQEHY